MSEVSQRVPLKEAAQILGVSQQSVREHMRRGIWKDLGDVIPPKKGCQRWQYIIFRDRLERKLKGENPMVKEGESDE